MFRRIPPTTAALIAGCVLWTGLAAILEWGPEKAGALRERALWDGEYWRLITATFLHEVRALHGTHLILNALSMLFVGRIIERACGKAVYLVCVAGSALGGFAMSVVATTGPDYWRMGISGVVAGLIGLLLAVEWCVSKTWLDFLKQRNTLVILFFVGLSIPIAAGIESANPDIKVDHAAHAGGLLFGLLAGLAYYGRRGRRPLLGAVVALVLGIVPIAYAAHPWFDADYQVWRGDRAYRAGDFDEAGVYYERALELRPGELVPRARLAEIRDDPALLDGLPEPDGIEESYAAERAYLRLAERRLQSDVDSARHLLAAAYNIRIASPANWFLFAEAAEKAGWSLEAYRAYQRAAEWYRLTGAASEEWKPLTRALRVLMLAAPWKDTPPDRRVPVLLEAVRAAKGSLGGLVAEEVTLENRRKLEAKLGEVARTLAGQALVSTGEPEAVHELYGTLAELFYRLAENTADERLAPGYRYRSAWWYFREQGEEDKEVYGWVQARFRAALSEAHEVKDERTQRAVEQWFMYRDLPVPELDLDEGEDGG